MLSRIFALSVTTLVVIAGSVHADFDDDFTMPSPGLRMDIVSGTPFMNSTTIAPGLTRTAEAFALSGGATAELGDFGTSSVFALSINRSSTGFGMLSYTYDTPEDLSAAGTDFILDYEFADINVPFSVTLTDDDGDSSTQSSTVVSGGATYTFSMMSFTGIDLDSISNINVSINEGAGSVPAADFSLDRVRIATPTPNNPVPAPASLILLAIGGAGLGLIRKRRGQPAVA